MDRYIVMYRDDEGKEIVHPKVVHEFSAVLDLAGTLPQVSGIGLLVWRPDDEDIENDQDDDQDDE